MRTIKWISVVTIILLSCALILLAQQTNKKKEKTVIKEDELSFFYLHRARPLETQLRVKLLGTVEVAGVYANVVYGVHENDTVR